MTKIISIIILVSCIFIVHAKEYHCTLDSTPTDTTINKKNASQYLKEFYFDSGKTKVGTSVSFNDFDVKMWVKNGMILILFKDLKRKIAITTKNNLEQKTLYLKVNPNLTIECLPKDEWQKQNKALNALLTPTIDDQSDLSLKTHNLILTTERDILFKYIQANANDKMRTILFQKGTLIRNSQQKDSSLPWCAFQIEIKLDEDTIIYKKTSLPPTTIKVLKNSDSHYVVSYSFVDFASGKRNFHTSRYTPFSLECQLPQKTPLTYKLFKEITGNYFSLAGSPQ